MSSPHEVEGEFLTTPAVVTHPPSIVEWRKASEISRTQPTGGARLKLTGPPVKRALQLGHLVCWHGDLICFETTCDRVEFCVEQ